MRTKYVPEHHPEQARILAEKGLIEQEIAEALGITRSTLSLWKTKHSAFSDALREGKRKPNRAVEAAVYQRAIGHKVREVHYRPGKREGDPAVPIRIVERDIPGNPRAQEYWLCNRMPKRWKRKITVDMGAATGRAEEHDPEKLKVMRGNMMLLMAAHGAQKN